jgi:hypothetical protein
VFRLFRACARAAARPWQFGAGSVDPAPLGLSVVYMLQRSPSCSEKNQTGSSIAEENSVRPIPCATSAAALLELVEK